MWKFICGLAAGTIGTIGTYMVHDYLTKSNGEQAAEMLSKTFSADILDKAAQNAYNAAAEKAGEDNADA